MMKTFANTATVYRHGGPYDLGSADRYYGREFHPHYFVGSTYQSEMVTTENMTEEEIQEYTLGFNEEQD